MTVQRRRWHHFWLRKLFLAPTSEVTPEPPPLLPHTYFTRSDLRDTDWIETTNTVTTPDKVLFLVFCDLTGLDSAGTIFDWAGDSTSGGGGSDGYSYFLIRARLGFWEVNLRKANGGGLNRFGGSASPLTEGPTLVWLSVDLTTGDHRACHGGPTAGGSGALNGAVHNNGDLGGGATDGHAALYEYLKTANRQTAGDVAALVVDQTAGALNDAALDRIAAETTVDAMYRQALTEIAATSAVVHFQPVPTATPVATAADMVDLTGNNTLELVDRTYRLSGGPDA
jgi:hypothetical protein